MQTFEDCACEIAEKFLGGQPASIQQFSTGLSHYVFEISSVEGLSYVIRIARPERIQEFERGIKWHEIIENIGVRLPKIFQTGIMDGCQFAVYERLMGDDLENVYASLSQQEKKSIAEEVAEIGRKIASLDRRLFAKISPWHQVLENIISRSEREILSHGLCDPKYVDLIRGEVDKHAGYFYRLTPSAFMYDLNVRNVMVFNGSVTGIFDVDDVWYGDPLLAVGRGKTILSAMEQDTDFINHWCKYLGLSEGQIEIVELYALLYCLRFMGTVGTQLNGNPSIQTNPENARLFERMADNILNI